MLRSKLNHHIYFEHRGFQIFRYFDHAMHAQALCKDLGCRYTSTITGKKIAQSNLKLSFMCNIVQLLQTEVGETWVRQAYQLTDSNRDRCCSRDSAVCNPPLRISSQEGVASISYLYHELTHPQSSSGITEEMFESWLQLSRLG